MTGFFIISNEAFPQVYPVTNNNNACAGESLNDFCHTVRVPEDLKTDQHSCFKKVDGGFKDAIRKHQIFHRYSEPEREGQMHMCDNPTRDIKQKWQQLKTEKSIPNCLWSFGVQHIARLLQHIPRQNKRTGRELVTGCTPDISDLVDFKFYSLV